MAKRVVIAHGWRSSPEDCWFPWFKAELEAKGFEVSVPAFPEPAYPKRELWVPALREAVGEPSEEVILVGHSLGNQAILRYLEELPVGVKIGGMVFVAGFYDHIEGLRDGVPAREFYASWFAKPFDPEAVRAHIGKSVAIFSDNDKWIPLDNQNGYRDKLGAEIVVVHEMGHFNKVTDGVTELPIVLEKVLEIAAE